MRARIVCTTTGREFFATAVKDERGRQMWRSDEGAYLGPVGTDIRPYQVKRVVEERRKE